MKTYSILISLSALALFVLSSVCATTVNANTAPQATPVTLAWWNNGNNWYHGRPVHCHRVCWRNMNGFVRCARRCN